MQDSGGSIDVKDPYNLKRFVLAQDPVFEQVCEELRQGYKSGHWMWYIFPQIKGLGYSQPSRQFAISSILEAKAYLAHPILGARLRECTRLVLAIKRRSIEEIFGYIDALKFRSSMTLFAYTTSENEIFKDALQKYFEGEPDQLTVRRL